MITYKDLEQFGLEEKEARVYLASLELGPATAAEIAQKASVKRATTYTEIELLMDMGLMSTYEHNKKTLFSAESPEALKRIIRNQEENLKTAASSLDGILPALLSMHNYAGEKPKVRFFEGKEGLIAIQDEFIKTKDKVNVANVLKEFIDKYHGIQNDGERDLLLGALGHDLLEDTKITEEDVRGQWGEKVLFYIKEMTNEKGDDSFDEYIEHLKSADEEVLLIKFADILANTRNSIKNISVLPAKWLADFWIPLLERYDAALLNKVFHRYPLTLNALAQEIKDNIERIKILQGR